MSALWLLLLEAQDSPAGVPQTFVEEKKQEMRRAREDDARALDERDRRDRDRPVRRGGGGGRGYGGRGGRFDDRGPPSNGGRIRDGGWGGRGGVRSIPILFAYINPRSQCRVRVDDLLHALHALIPRVPHHHLPTDATAIAPRLHPDVGHRVEKFALRALRRRHRRRRITGVACALVPRHFRLHLGAAAD